ncbi:MAG: helix-turn-helix transcriptional regulator [Alphaproteobacteria bacterium]
MPDKLPGWPRLLSRQLAAAYCGISVNHFLANVPVAPRRIGTRALWDKAEIDQWIDATGQAVTMPGPAGSWDKELEEALAKL